MKTHKTLNKHLGLNDWFAFGRDHWLDYKNDRGGTLYLPSGGGDIWRFPDRALGEVW